MLGKLFARNEKTPAAPEGMRIYAIGDIHGCASELAVLLEKISSDSESADLKQQVFSNITEKQADPKPQHIFLGDYVDRGPDSKGVIDSLIALKQTHPATVFLKGNHEAMMLDFLKDPEDMYRWLDWGGEETLKSYGVDNVVGRSPEDLATEFNDRVPETHLAFLNGLHLMHREGDFLFAHAGVRPGVAIEDQQEEDLLWIRKRFHKASAHERPDCVVVHGHQPMKKPLDAGWRIAVDTGACWTGKLTAVVLEGQTRRFIST